MLCAPEHMRPAEPEEISELVKLHASLKDIVELVNGKGPNPIGYVPEEGDDDSHNDDWGGLFPDGDGGGDENRAARIRGASVPVKAKAGPCVGHRDPDIGIRELSVDAPTTTKASLVAGIQCAMSNRGIGDVQAAFLNGVQAPRSLYFGTGSAG